MKYIPEMPTKKFSFKLKINLKVCSKLKSIIDKNIRSAITKFMLIVQRIYLTVFSKLNVLIKVI